MGDMKIINGELEDGKWSGWYEPEGLPPREFMGQWVLLKFAWYPQGVRYMPSLPGKTLVRRWSPN